MRLVIDIWDLRMAVANGMPIPKGINMTDIETLIIEASHRRDLTYAKNFNGRAYALMDVDWIGYFNTLDEVLKYLDISVETDKERR